MNWAFDVPICGPQKAVLIALANHADDDGRNCFPSVQRLMLSSGFRERAVQMALRELEESGWITKEAKGGGRMMPARYALNVARLPNTSDKQPAMHKGARDAGNKNGASHAGNGARGALNGASHAGNGAPDAPEPSLTINNPHEPVPPPTPPQAGERGFELVGENGEPLPDLVDRAVSIWNAKAGDKRRIQRLTSKRRGLIARRLREEFDNDIDRWGRFCLIIARAGWLNGGSDGSWFPAVEWCLKPEKLTAILSGQYRPAPSDGQLRTSL